MSSPKTTEEAKTEQVPEEETASSEIESPFKPGEHVTITGLVKGPQYNNKLAKILEAIDPASGRHFLEICESGKQLKIRVANLKVYSGWVDGLEGWTTLPSSATNGMASVDAGKEKATLVNNGGIVSRDYDSSTGLQVAGSVAFLGADGDEVQITLRTTGARAQDGKGPFMETHKDYVKICITSEEVIIERDTGAGPRPISRWANKFDTPLEKGQPAFFFIEDYGFVVRVVVGDKFWREGGNVYGHLSADTVPGRGSVAIENSPTLGSVAVIADLRICQNTGVPTY